MQQPGRVHHRLRPHGSGALQASRRDPTDVGRRDLLRGRHSRSVRHGADVGRRRRRRAACPRVRSGPVRRHRPGGLPRHVPQPDVQGRGRSALDLALLPARPLRPQDRRRHLRQHVQPAAPPPPAGSHQRNRVGGRPAGRPARHPALPRLVQHDGDARRQVEGEQGGVAGQQVPDVLLRQRVRHDDERGDRDASRLVRRAVLLGRRLLHHRPAAAEARPVGRPSRAVHLGLRAQRTAPGGEVHRAAVVPVRLLARAQPQRHTVRLEEGRGSSTRRTAADHTVRAARTPSQSDDGAGERQEKIAVVRVVDAIPQDPAVFGYITF